MRVVLILAIAIAGAADMLVTGDSDLLLLSESYPVVTPAEFMQQL